MKILITLDGSEFAEAIWEPITQLAAISAAEVHVIEVVKPPASSTGWTQAPLYRSPRSRRVDDRRYA